MTFALLAVGVLLLCLPFWLAPIARRLHPRERLRVLLAALSCGAVLVELALVLLAVPAVVGVSGNQALAASCRRLLGDLAPGGFEVGWSAAALAALLPVLAWRGWAQAFGQSEQMWIEPSLGTHEELDGIDRVRLPTPAVLAYSLDGEHPQIVVSDGLVALLTPDELEAVLQHEAAHVRERHGRTLRWLTAIETAVPLVRWTNRSLRIAMERCADEIAAEYDDRRRRALLDALVRVSTVDAPVWAMAFTNRSGVVERAEALLIAPPVPTRLQRFAVFSTVAGGGALGVAIVSSWAYEAHMMLSMVGACRM